MATHNITITYPDGQASTILDAIKGHMAFDSGLDAGTITNAEALAFIDDETRNLIRRIVKNRIQYEASVVAQQTPVDIT